jgi:hypothetical protein
MGGKRTFGDRDAMARMRKYRSFNVGLVNASNRPFAVLPSHHATGGERQKAAVDGTRQMRQLQLFARAGTGPNMNIVNLPRIVGVCCVAPPLTVAQDEID